MSGRTDSVGKTPPPAFTSSGSPTTPKNGGATPPGTGDSSSTMKSLNSAVVATRSFGAAVWTGIKHIPTYISDFFSKIAEKIVELIWGVPAAGNVDVVLRSYWGFGSDYVMQLPLDQAIIANRRNKEGTRWTAEYAVAKKKCSQEWVRERALHVIEFKYGAKDMQMMLLTAVNERYFTWDQAIDEYKFITRDEAIRGGFVKDPSKKETK